MTQTKDEAREEFLNKNFEFIIKELSGSRLYGELIDVNNFRDAVVTAYFLGVHKDSRFPVEGFKV